MKIPALAALALCISLPAQAADWNVVKSKSRLGFSVLWQDHPFRGEFKSWDAKIHFDPADPAKAKASVSIDIASVTSGESEMDDALKSAQGFDAANYAKATFDTTWFRATGKDSYEARGVLTLHGITKAVTLPFKLVTKGDMVEMKGTAKFSRIDFKIGMGQWAAPTPVAHEVTVSIDITATKAK